MAPYPISVLSVLLACASLGAAPRAFHVSPGGDDGHPGTAAKPFRTIPRAMEAVRELDLPSNPGTPVSVYLRGGVHEVASVLHFGPEDTGTMSSPVTYRSYPDERAVISGGRRIRGQWRKVPGKDYYEVHVPEARERKWVFNSLYVNGMSRTRARTPNWGEKVLRAKGRAPGEDERQAFAYFPGDINPTWTNLTDVDLVLLCSWTPTIHRIREVIPDRHVVRFHSSHGRSVDFWERNFRYYAINVFEALDQPGEWYLNRETGMLYYFPLPGDDLAVAEVIAPVLKGRMMEFMGDIAAGRFVEHLRFAGLDFRHVDGDLDAYNGMYRQGHMFLDAAIYAEGLRSTSFVGCEIAQVGEYAMEMTAGCRDNRVEQCHIWDTGAGAMQIGITSLGALLAEYTRIRPGDIVLEAEDGLVASPMVVEADATASKGSYAVLPEGSEGGMVTFSIDMAGPGEFVVLARVIAPSGSADSFVVQVNDGQRLTYDTGVGQRWWLSRIVARELEGKAVIAHLKEGRNTIVLAGREAGARLDQLILRPLRDDVSVAGEPVARAVLSNVIDNNLIHRTGTIWHGCYAIVNRFASLTQITHNDISDTHWNAIGLDARWTYRGETHSHGNVVAYNHLHHLGLRYHADAAGIYQFGPLDTFIHHNRIHDTQAYPYICGFAGIYLDEQSRGALVEDNLVYNTDWMAYFQHKGVDNTFRNNIGAFARDGLVHRGGLDERWRTNTFEVYRNIYIARDEVALRHSWEPGLVMPVIRDNMYYSMSGVELTFGGKSLGEWQALGNDRGSVIGDPGCKDPGALNFALRPDAAAIAAIGFVPFDEEIGKVGLHGEPEWTALPDSLERRTPSQVWTPDDLAKLIGFELDFEDMPDGHEPSIFRLVNEGDATFAVTSEAACTGSKSYKCVDRKGLRKPFYPYIHIAPRRLVAGSVAFAFDVMNSKKAPMRFYAEFRGKGQTSDVGPSLHWSAAGTLTANGMEILTAEPGSWCHVAIRFELGADAPKEYSLLTRHDGAEQTQTIPFAHETFSEIRWLGISASDDADGVFYLDNMSLRIE